MHGAKVKMFIPLYKTDDTFNSAHNGTASTTITTKKVKIIPSL